MRVSYNEEGMTDFIKHLLCLGSNSSWITSTMANSFAIRFKGNCRNVQKNILSWLSIPERKQLMEMKGGKK